MKTAGQIESLQEAAARHLPEALDWLQRMVAINSFTSNAAGVDALAKLTAECFEPLGFTAELVRAKHPDYGCHLFLRRHPTLPSTSKPIVLVTHLDTVFPEEEEKHNAFAWKEVDDRIYGPGTVDNKGGTMLIWLMLIALREAAPETFEGTDWLIAANAAEEVIGSDFADRTHERCPVGASAVLVFEGWPRDETYYHMVTSRKGRAECRITVEGRGAHAGSQHSDGINAIVELSKLLPNVAALTDELRHLTVNVAHVEGGTVLNRVPHLAVAELEMRAFEPAILEQALEALNRMSGTTETGARITVECFGMTRAWPGGEETRQLFNCWQAAAGQIGLPLIAVPRGGLSDANYLCGLGPTLDALGPCGAHAHCSEWLPEQGKLPEYVERSSFIPKVVLNCLALILYKPTAQNG